MPSLIKETFKSWHADNPFQLSAVVAYDGVLALSALPVIIINVVGSIWGVEITQRQLTDEFSSALDPEAAKSIEQIIGETRQSEKITISTIIGIATLLFGQ